VNRFIEQLCTPLGTTALSLISTVHKSLGHTKSAQLSLDVSWKRFLTVELFQLHALLTPLPAGHRLATELVESESSVMTDGQPASLSWNKAPIWRLRPDFYYCQKVAGLLMWGALSDERTGLSCKSPAGPRQRSHFRIRFLWDP
jgi:hypothetical protein